MNNHFLNFFIGATFSIIVLILKWWAIKYKERVKDAGRFLLANAIFRFLMIVVTFFIVGFNVTWLDAFIFLAGYLIFQLLLNRLMNSIKNVSSNTKL